MVRVKGIVGDCVVSSSVLLYSTLSEARDRAAAERREEIARIHTAMVEKRGQEDHELIRKIHEHLDEIRHEIAQHVNVSLDNIQTILVERLETLQAENHGHIEEMQQEIAANIAAHRKELVALTALVNAMRDDTRPPTD
jgi:hypothetical protein